MKSNSVERTNVIQGRKQTSAEFHVSVRSGPGKSQWLVVGMLYLQQGSPLVGLLLTVLAEEAVL